MSGEKSSKKRTFKMPHVYVLLSVILIIVALCTYAIPAGVFDRVQDPGTGRMLVDPASFHTVEKSPVNLFKLAVAIPKGMAASVSIMMLVVLVVAAFEIVTKTGAFDSGITHMMKRSQGKESFIVAVITVMFASIGAFLGWAEGTLVFVPLGVSLARAMGYDALMGAGMVLLGTAAGFTSGVLNIYTTGIAQAISGLPLFSALGFRMIGFCLFTLATILFLISYGKKIKNNPSASLIYELEMSAAKSEEQTKDLVFTGRHRLIMLTVLLGFITVVIGTTKLGWYLNEITAVFILVGVVSGFIGKMSPNDMALNFAQGAKNIIPAALTIGIARSVLVVMEEGKILDTVVHGLASSLHGLPTVGIALGIFLIVSALNFFIISASGKAVTMMPVLAPLADILGINRQVVVIAFQYGDGFTNWFWPTSAITMAGLAMAGGIPWEKWARWCFRLILVWMLTAAVLVTIAQVMGVGPF
jgi:uncharacterized ion transporter superfamily protein YfcC